MRGCSVALSIVAAAVLSGPVQAQQPVATPDPEILKTVQRFFDAMRTKDTTTLRALVDSGTRLVTTLTREGRPLMRGGSIDRFIQAVGAAQQPFDERIYEPEVRQDENLATVWTRYTFHLAGHLSHCGYDAFQLFKSESGWKVFHIADTQRREGCAP
ncbi:MAG: hypothetical protein ACREN5_11285 [Gemmatimonadales bacterium]